MAVNYTTMQDSDFSGGIDSRSAENQIPESYVKDLLNADIVERRIRKRAGYQGHAGELPVRISSMRYISTTNEICFTLDSAISLDSEINLETVRSSPLLVYGKSSVFSPGDGPFDTGAKALKYYSGFTVPLRKQLQAGTNTLLIPASEHGMGTTNIFVRLVESSSLSDRSYRKILPDAIRIDKATYDIEIDYTIYQDAEAIVYFSNKAPVVGSTYVHTIVHSGTPINQTTSITPATHGLANFNIIPQLMQDTGTEMQVVLPKSLTVSASGTVDIVIENDTGSSQSYELILTSSPIQNTVSGNVQASSTGVVSLTSLEKPWLFTGIYLETSALGDKELVLADSLSYSDPASSATVEFDNSTSSAKNFTVIYEYGDLRSNELCVSDSSVTVTGEDLAPQVDIYGLSHSEIYGPTKFLREGWVTYIDSYRRALDQRVIAGLGGTLYSADTAAALSAPILHPNIATRTAVGVVLAPLLHETGELPGRTRGYITGEDQATGWARVSSVEYLVGGLTRYTLDIPNKQIVDSSANPTTLTSVISTAANLEDYLTVTDMSYARHNGTFRIVAVTDGTDQIFVDVDNPDNTEDYNDTGVGGSAGVFTDQLEWLTSSPYIAQDQLISSALDSTTVYTVVGSQADVTTVSGVEDILGIAAGVVFTARRTSRVIPLRTGYPGASASVGNLVRGDMLSYTGIERLLRIKYINPDQDRTVDITSDGETATCTLTSGTTQFLTVGTSVLLTQAGPYTGVHTVTSIPSLTEFLVASSLTDTVSGATLVGSCIVVDEELDFSDTQADQTTFTVPLRWMPVEGPDDLSLRPRYFDTNTYGGQPYLRSSMVVDNMYLTNSQDEVYKYDGQSNYRAGIIPWQPGAFLTQETTGATIVTDLRSIAYSAITAGEGRLTITAQTTNTLPLGAQVRLTGSMRTYTVRAYDNDTTNFYILLDRALDSGVAATGNVAEIGTYRYYFRLNAVDANNNIIASAVTGYQDHVVELTQNASIQLKLVGLPIWDVYDYARLEVQIYRTKINTQAPFYRITTLPMQFSGTDGYVLFRDSFADSDLLELDEVSTALKGAELGVAWSDPLRAKYVTSISNRLVLANIRSYPELDIQLLAGADLADSALDTDSILFLRSELDTQTSTDVVNRIRYEWIEGFTGTPAGVTPGVDEFTVSGIAESISAGDWIYLTYSTVSTTGRDLTLSGLWQINSVAGAGPYTATILYPGLATPASVPDRYVLASDPQDIPVLLGVDGNLGMVNGDSYNVFDATRRLSIAINASMRQVDTSISGMESFVPWITARSGNDVGSAGRILVRQPRADFLALACKPSFSGYSLFINSIRRASGDLVSASTSIFPSRILVSYENYPEIFDNPTAVLDIDSDSSIDINSADGQEITGIIPFFGEAAFGAAQQSAILVVFKTNSIYLVDLNQKQQGLPAVQRIETEGLGCTAPYSIAATKSGIMFANESGIYCLRRTQSIEYIGRFMERNWTERVDLDSLGLVQGHHYGVGRVYKLSVPLSSATGYVENKEVFVYNHTQEIQGQLGAWSRYENHPATGWANLGRDAYFSSTSGRVFSIRRTGLPTDYRDDDASIYMQLDTRANHFGNPAIRKVINDIVVDYRNVADSSSVSTRLDYSLDTAQEYSPTSSYEIDKYKQTSNLSDPVNRDITSIRHSLSNRKGLYIQLRITNNGRDESVEISGISYRVGGLSGSGILEARSTTENN